MTDMSIRHQGASARGPRPVGPAPIGPRRAAGPAGAGPRPTGTAPRTKADPTAARVAVGAGGVAAALALIAAIAAPAAAQTSQATALLQAPIEPPVQHVTRIVVIPSTQTPPPRQVVMASPLPAPTARVVTIVTSQSGKP